MGVAIPLVMAGLGAAGIGSQVYGNVKNQRFLERQAEKEERLRRRGSIERAIGSFGAKPPLFTRSPAVSTPPDLTGSAIVGGAANIGLTMLPSFLQAYNSTPAPTMPQSQGMFPTSGMGQFGNLQTFAPPPPIQQPIRVPDFGSA